MIDYIDKSHLGKFDSSSFYVTGIVFFILAIFIVILQPVDFLIDGLYSDRPVNINSNFVRVIVFGLISVTFLISGTIRLCEERIKNYYQSEKEY